MLLFRQPHSGPGPTPEELRQIMGRFTEWMSRINVIGTHGLEPTGTVLRGPRGASIMEGPFCETKEIVGGYVIITADTLNTAIEIARDCPGLDYRMAVEVRPVVKQRPESLS